MLRLFRILKAFAVTSLRTFANREQLERFQQKKLKSHLRWVKANIPFYHGLDLDKWTAAPLMNRKLFMEHFEELNVAGLSRQLALTLVSQAEREGGLPHYQGLSIGLSTGTSSASLDKRGIFLASEAERFEWAGTILAKALGKAWYKKQRIALFLRSNSSLYTGVRSQRIQFAYFDLDTQVKDQLKALNAFEPTIVVAPSSRLRALAELKGRTFKPKKLFAGAEVLETLDKQAIEAAFALPVHSIYQATEGFLGFSCSRANLHLNEDIFFLEKEYLDKASGRFVPIITDYRRKTQAVIRYRLDDILREIPCQCGSVMQAVRVEGREADAFVFTKLDGSPFIVYPDDIRTMFTFESLRHFQVHYVSPVSLRVACEPYTPELTKAITLKFENYCQVNRLRLPQLDFSAYMFRSGPQKLRRIKAA